MLKEEITFPDLDGNPVTRTFYFNLTMTELVKLEAHEDGGFSKMLADVVKSKDNKLIWDRFEWMLSQAYGERDADNIHFIKEPELWKRFTQTSAFDILMVKLLSDSAYGGKFISSMMPAEMAKGLTDVDVSNPDEVLALIAKIQGEREATDSVEDDEIVELPAEKPWAHRDPTRQELLEMSKADLLEVMARKQAERA